jgi:hypothetical protein
VTAFHTKLPHLIDYADEGEDARISIPWHVLPYDEDGED